MSCIFKVSDKNVGIQQMKSHDSIWSEGSLRTFISFIGNARWMEKKLEKKYQISRKMNSKQKLARYPFWKLKKVDRAVIDESGWLWWIPIEDPSFQRIRAEIKFNIVNALDKENVEIEDGLCFKELISWKLIYIPIVVNRFLPFSTKWSFRWENESFCWRSSINYKIIFSCQNMA